MYLFTFVFICSCVMKCNNTEKQCHTCSACVSIHIHILLFFYLPKVGVYVLFNFRGYSKIHNSVNFDNINFICLYTYRTFLRQIV
jgi:hypothetical protein